MYKSIFFSLAVYFSALGNSTGFLAPQNIRFGKSSSSLRKRPSTDLQMGSSVSSVLRNPTTSLILGGAGLGVILVNRLSIELEQVSMIQSRADIISVIACSALLLNALSESEVQMRDRDAVTLSGFSLQNPVLNKVALADNNSEKLKWVCRMVVEAAEWITSVHIITQEGVMARYGVVTSGDNGSVTEIPLAKVDGPILKKAFGEAGEEVYLPDLQILPGRVEFLKYLPNNCQCVVVVPTPDGAVVVGSNRAKSITESDIDRVRAVLSLAF